jgi:hypothetical protein
VALQALHAARPALAFVMVKADMWYTANVALRTVMIVGSAVGTGAGTRAGGVVRRGLAGGLLVRGAAGVSLMPVDPASGRVTSQPAARPARQGGLLHDEHLACRLSTTPRHSQWMQRVKAMYYNQALGLAVPRTAHGLTSGCCQWPLTSVPAQDCSLQHAVWRTHKAH